MQILSKKTVTARKAHVCMTCSATAIQPGQTYRRATYIYDGRIYNWVQCVECDALGGIVYDWSGADEGVGLDEYVEWAEEHRDDGAHGEAARAYLVRLRPATNRTDGDS